ncbi:MAG: AMP-binding protein [Myxococcota bacterium]|nr:AMP-binding protein [Myxococcota bacterium]
MVDTIPKRLFEQAKRAPERPAYLVKEGGVWKTTSWTGYAQEVEQAARALIALGFQPGQRVCILGFNRPEWVIMDLAAMAAGGAPAGIYTTCSPHEVQYIAHHSEAPLILVENADQANKVFAERANLPELKHVVVMRGPKVEGAMSWEEFLARGSSVATKEVHDRIDALEPNALATLIYTSGTTGPPKAVMLSHENLAWTATVLRELTKIEAGGRSLSYLPLSHIAEQMVTIHGPITGGSAVYFAESIEKIADNLKDARPTLFFGVPRIWEKFHSAIAGKLAGATGAKAKIAQWARGVGTQVSALKNRGQEPTGMLALQYALANRLVFSKLKEAIGLDQATVMVTGAAPIAKEVVEFFASLDLIVQEVYGQSEDSGPTTLNVPGRTKFGSVGPALPGVEVKIAEDDEILVRGKNVFLGYFKDEAATKETLDEQGYLHSGDLGKFDEEGFLHITGRKKDIIITAGGKNITPKNIESGVKNHPAVGECVVIGDRRKFLSMVISLDPEATPKWMEEHGESGAPHESAALRASIQQQIDEVNAKLARVEQVKKFTILSRPFGIDTGELTPTLKVKRNIVAKNFDKEIEAMYAGDKG